MHQCWRPYPVPSKRSKKKPWLKRSKSPDDAFYTSPEWRKLSYQILRDSDGRCCACGMSAADGAKIVVCHVKSPKSHPELKLDRDNLQVLCSEHRHVKGMLGDETDWRKESSWQATRLGPEEPLLSVLFGESLEEEADLNYEIGPN